MPLRANKLLKYLPLEIQYREIKALEEIERQYLAAQARGRLLCFGLSLVMATIIIHPKLNQWVETKLQLNRIANISFATVTSDKPQESDKIAAALVNYARNNKWEVRTGKRRYNIFYVQGMFPNGVKNDNTPNQFNDSRFLVEINPIPKLIGAWEASVEPGDYYTKRKPMNPNGAAHIKVPGQYRAWRIGYHKTQFALVQVAPVDIIRDFNRNGRVDSKDVFVGKAIIGANQHGGYDNKKVDDASAGCPVGRTTLGHQEFMRYLQQDADYQVDKNLIFSTGFISSKDLKF